MKANFGIMPALGVRINKRERGKAYAKRALQDLALAWNADKVQGEPA